MLPYFLEIQWKYTLGTQPVIVCKWYLTFVPLSSSRGRQDKLKQFPFIVCRRMFSYFTDFTTSGTESMKILKCSATYSIWMLPHGMHGW